MIAALAMLAGASIVVVPDGHAAVRISQISGVRPGTLYAGTHFIAPLFERVELFRHSRPSVCYFRDGGPPRESWSA